MCSSTVINLSNPKQIPDEYSFILKNHRNAFLENEHLDKLLNIPEISLVADKLNSLCSLSSILGYHYTRAEKSSILAKGLEIRNGQERREFFLKEYGNRFTEALQERIKLAWDDYFDHMQEKSRNGRIWFSAIEIHPSDEEVHRLLKYFGGESIYMPLTKDKEIAEILTKIGEPLVIKCKLKPNRLSAYSDRPFGKTWLSSYHIAENPQASRLSWDLSSEYNVPASDIIEVQTVGRH